MGSEDAAFGLTDRLLESVLDRLELGVRISPDLEGLRAVYGAWCVHVPFDNLRKIISLRTAAAGPLPGGQAGDFFRNWLVHGAGGTCWPTSNALFELLRRLGFDARRVTGSMRDLGSANHASVKVGIGGEDWLVDSSMLTNMPLPLAQAVYVSEDPVIPAEIEPVDGTYILWTHIPPNSCYLPCRLMGESDHDFYLASYEGTRERSVFNQRLYARKNDPGRVLVLAGHTLFIRTVRGLETSDLAPDQIRRVLREEMGISEALIEEWARSGGLAECFEEPSGPKSPPVIGQPPSQRDPAAATSSSGA